MTNSIKYVYNVEFNQHFILKEELSYFPNGRISKFFSRETNTENSLSIISFGSTIKVPKASLTILNGNTISNNTVLGAFLKSNVDISELSIVQDWFSQNLMALINPNDSLFAWTSNKISDDVAFRDKVVEIMNKADVQISSIEIDERKKDIILHHTVINNDSSKIYKLPKHLESLGTKRFYELSGILVTLIQGNKVSCIDEIESSLHSDLMMHFILMHLANSSSSQLIITTHNLSLLEEKDILRNDAVWFTQKQKDGATELYSLDDFDSSVFRKGASLINSYRIGKLGATPNLGSIFLKE